jgi:DNA-binding MarR family transcriptional regulator
MAIANKVRARQIFTPLTAAKASRRVCEEVSPRKPADLGRLNDLLGFHIRRVQLWSFQNFNRRLAALDIRPADYSVLCVVEANKGVSQTDLSNALGIERAHLVRLLHRLEKKSLLKRATSSVDLRRHSLELTSYGRTILAKSHQLVTEHDKLLNERIGLERHPEIKRAFQEFQSD